MSKLTWQWTVLLCVAVPSVAALVYGLVKSGENIGGIAAAVGTVLGAMGWQAHRTNTKLDKVEKLANGNLSRADAARDAANRKSIEHLHAVYQQLVQVAAQSPPGTLVPPLPVLVPAGPGADDPDV